MDTMSSAALLAADSSQRPMPASEVFRVFAKRLLRQNQRILSASKYLLFLRRKFAVSCGVDHKSGCVQPARAYLSVHTLVTLFSKAGPTSLRTSAILAVCFGRSIWEG